MQILVGGLEYQTDEYGYLLKRRGQGRLKFSLDKDGYQKYCITTADGKVNVRVHRIIWEVFNGPIPWEMTINHKDRNKENNAIANLELMEGIDNVIEGNAKVWKITDPNGVPNLIWNMQAFCREHKLNANHMREVCNGKILSYKGWTK